MPPNKYPVFLEKQNEDSIEGSEILITGIAGRFPKAQNVKQFKDNLYGKVDMLSSSLDRWAFSHPQLPPKLGLISDLDKFDAQFFAVNYKQAEAMDPMTRILMECVCEAVVEAGLNPRSLRDSNTGVFMSVTIMENEKEWFYNSAKIDGYGFTGSSRAMFANRISYWLGLKGPSYTMDGNDCSGALVLEKGYQAIMRGYCDSAIVGCSNTCLNPTVSLHLSRMGVLTLDNHGSPFTNGASGYARAESIVVIVLQKSRDAKRVFAQLVNAKASFTSIVKNRDRQGYPSGEPMKRFLGEFYRKSHVNPEDVNYVEACGIGIDQNDKEELAVLDEVFCSKYRKEPLMVGAVKSNMGNSETASVLCALVKILMAYHTGEIAPNIHMDSIRTDVEAIQNGRLQVIKDKVIFDKLYAAVNSFSWNGLNGHVLLKGFNLNRVQPLQALGLPRLVCVSGRIEESIDQLFNDLELKPLDARQLALIHSTHEKEVPGFVGRGYNILKTKCDKTIGIKKMKDYYGGEKRPVWFVYTGMGPQWISMGANLMQIPIFAAAINKCHQVLEPYGVDLLRILTVNDPKTFENILHAFVGIVAVQIGLTDILTAIEITADHYIGHSFGEIGCAYADGCLSAEQTILTAYYRGLVSIQTPLIRGSMAAVGLGYKSIKSMIPTDIEVACHNSADSCTISGAADAVKAFVKQLSSQGIFVKVLPSVHIAYHSRHIAPAGHSLKSYLSTVITNPKLRSDRWISTSVPQPKWDDISARYSSAEYMTNNLLSPVLFEEAARLIQPNAITIEVSPHGLLQAILKRSLSPSCLNVALSKRGNADNVTVLLESVGKLYVAGLNPKVQNLYPPVDFPVSADTPLLSHTLRWEHSETWHYTLPETKPATFAGERRICISTKDRGYNYLSGYVISGITCLAPAALLVLVWETLGMIVNVPYTLLPVEFLDIRFEKEVFITEDEILELEVLIQKASGKFEVVIGKQCVCCGQIQVNKLDQRTLPDTQDIQQFHSDEYIYQMFAKRGHNYEGLFRSLQTINKTFTKGQLRWTGNWITFLDGMMQVMMMKQLTPSRPKTIQRISINTQSAKWCNMNIMPKDKDIALDFLHYPEHNLTRVKGVEIKGLIPIDVTLTRYKALDIDHPQTINKEETNNDSYELASSINQYKTTWLQKKHNKLGNDNITVQVHYVSISQADVTKARGPNINGEENNESVLCFGMSYSGITKTGSRVMGLVETGAAAMEIEANPSLLWPVPAYWTLEEAACVPFVYGQALYCLKCRGLEVYTLNETERHKAYREFFGSETSSLSSGSKVLITNGCTALGQAIISLCLADGRNVFTTVNDVWSKRFLLKLFPKLNERNICIPQKYSLIEFIIENTNGELCDIVISSAQDSLRQIIKKCLGPLGTFVNIDNESEDFEKYPTFGMNFLLESKSYITPLFSSIFTNRSLMKFVQREIHNGIAKNLIQPITSSTFEAYEASEAIKLLNTRRTPGAVLLRIINNNSRVITENKYLSIQLKETLTQQNAKIDPFTLSKNTQAKELKGIKSLDWSKFFGPFGDDEIKAAEPIVWLPTEASEADAIEEIYDGNDYLIVVPSIDGQGQSLRNLCRRLKVRVLLCQFAVNDEAGSIQELADQLTQVIKKNVGIGGRFFILGYSFGTLVALEMASLFEKSGMKGKLYFVDGSPMVIRESLKYLARYKSDEVVQSDVLLHICSMVAKNQPSKDFKQSLITEKDEKAKIKLCLVYLRDKTAHSTDFLETILRAACCRIAHTKDYRFVSPKLVSDIVIVKKKLEKDFENTDDLKQLSRATVTINELEANTEEVIDDIRAADIINTELGMDILDKFERSNLCKKQVVII